MTDSEAESFLKQWAPFIHKGCNKLSNSREDAEDLAQDVKLRVWSNRVRIEPENAAALVYVIIGRTAADNRKKSKSRPVELTGEVYDVNLDFASTEDTYNFGENMLGDSDGAWAFWKHYIEGYSVKELADELGIKYKTMRDKMDRLRVKLRVKYAGSR